MNEKERKGILSETVSALRNENEELKIKLRQLADSIIAKDEYTLTLESQCEKCQETEANLEQQLKKLLESEKRINNDHEKSTRELRSTIEEYKKVEKQLRESLIDLEKQRVDANNKITLLESNLKTTSFKLDQAEDRERQAFDLAQQAKKDAADMVETMHKNVADDRKKYRQKHDIEIKQYESELIASRKENTRLSSEIFEVKSSIEKQIKDFTVSLQQADARNSTLAQKLPKNTDELKERTKQYDTLLLEINEVSVLFLPQISI